MNSVISTFKDKKNTMTTASNVPVPNGVSQQVHQDNGCQYPLQRGKRKSSNKLLAPIVTAAADSDDQMHLHPSVDAADCCPPAVARLSCVDVHSVYNMNVPIAKKGNLDMDATIEDDHSTVACISRSRSSVCNDSTMVHRSNCSPKIGEASDLYLTSTLSAHCELHPTLSSLNSKKQLAECTSSGDGCSELSLVPPVISKCGNGSPSTTSTPTIRLADSTANHKGYSKSRLGCEFNQSMPSVHGRPNWSVACGMPPKHSSKHHRNLNLDFRSVGILLSPDSNATSTGAKHTKHQRNRSLDSALQRVPEIESETTICSPSSLLVTNMCSKAENIVSNDIALLSTCPSMPALHTLAHNAALGSGIVATGWSATDLLTHPATIRVQRSQHIPTEVGDYCATLQMRPESIELAATGVQDIVDDKSDINGGFNNITDADICKKREDFNSLGSDDSGVICGSESDQISLKRFGNSHECLDSGADAQIEEEIVESIKTTSMDVDYNLAESSNRSFFSSHADNNFNCRTLRPRDMQNPRKREQTNRRQDKEHCESDDQIHNRVMNMSRAAINLERATAPNAIEPVPDEHEDDHDSLPTFQNKSSNKMAPGATTSAHVTSPTDSIKSDQVLFKNFFGATKNAIFRTAQNIIENHERRNAVRQKSGESQDILLANATQNRDLVKSPTDISKKKESFSLLSSNATQNATAAAAAAFGTTTDAKFKQSYECGGSGLLRFFESPVFNIHFAVHYLFYSKEPGVLSFIGNKIFSFPDHEVDLYIPQLIVMYIQMDELAEVLDPYLTVRCRKSVDFSLKCLWLFEAYNFQVDSNNSRKSKLALIRELFSKKESKQQSKSNATVPLVKRTHHRSQSDATVLLADSGSHWMHLHPPNTTHGLPTTPVKLCLGDLTSGRAFDNGCTCFDTVRGQVNGLLGHRTFCYCGAPKTTPQKEFMKALMNAGKNLISLPSKAEKTSALRMFLNLINKNLPARVWLPLYSDTPHHVVRITEEKTAVLNSKDKTPYIIYVEVVEVPDIYTSPLIPKMMPSLRHTKSEEHLEGTCSHAENGCGDSGTHNCCCSGNHSNLLALGGLQMHEDDVWSQEDDEITEQYLNMRKINERDADSQMSLDSCDSRDQGPPILFNIGDVRTRHCNNLSCENTKSFSNDPEDPSAAALKEPWHKKEKLIRESSPYGHLPNWRLMSVIVKCGDDLRQELMATQLLQMFKIIWLEENVDLWVQPYKIICLSNDSGLIEPILNTVSLHQIKRNSNKSLHEYFIDEYGASTGEGFRQAQKNFVQSCAAYCLISYLLQVKDRHNGNILFHSDGHIIHIDFGFILSISPKNLGFEQSPFKLTNEFVEVMGGIDSVHWREFNRLLLVGMMSVRKHMDRIINFVEIMRSNAHMPCFRNGCSGTVQNLRKRFHMNLTEQEMERKVEQLVQDSLKSLSTKLYDGYQYYTNGIL